MSHRGSVITQKRNPVSSKYVQENSFPKTSYYFAKFHYEMLYFLAAITWLRGEKFTNLESSPGAARTR